MIDVICRTIIHGKGTKIMAIFISLIFSLFLIPTEWNSLLDIYFSNERQPESEQAHLLILLNEMPDELEITDPVHLEAIDAFIQKTEMDFDSETVVEFAATIKRALTPLASYMKGAEAIRKLYDDFENILTQTQKQTLLITIAELNNWARNHEVAFEMLHKMPPEIEDVSLRGWAYLTIGESEYRLGRYNAAIEHYLTALSDFREIDAKSRIAEVNNRLGNLYYSLKDFETSIRYYQRTIEIAAETEDEKALGNGYLNLGAAYRQSGDLDSALESFQKGMALSEKIGNVMEVARAKMNIANLYAEMQSFDEALQNYRESLAISEQYGIEYGVMINQLNIGNLHFDENLFVESEEAYLAAYNLMDRENHKYELLDISEKIAKLYETTGDYQQALNFLKLFTEINAEIFDTEKLKITENLREEYETELKDQDLALATLTIAKQKLRNRIYIVLIFLLAVMLSAGFIYYKKRNQYYRTLYRRNLELIQSLGIESESINNGKINIVDKKKDSDQLRELYKKIEPLFKEEKIYRDPDLKISHIAKRVRSNRKYVSEAIQEVSNMHFNNFVNFYRVNEAKKIMLKGNDSISDVQYASGFNSRTTFYTAFKKFTGMSPSKFKKISRQEISE